MTRRAEIGLGFRFSIFVLLTAGGVAAPRVGRADALPPASRMGTLPGRPSPAITQSTGLGASAGDIVWIPRLLVQSDALVARNGPDAPAISDGTTHPGLYLRRARGGAEAVAGVFRARLILEVASQSETADADTFTRAALDPIAGELGVRSIDQTTARAPRATEAFIAFAPHKGFAFAAGSLRVPIGLSRQIDEADLRLPERARIITRATPDFRVGVAAGGDLGLLQYALGSYSAAPTFGRDFSGGGTLYVLRLAGEPVGPVGVAPHLRRHDDPWAVWWRFSAGLTLIYGRLPDANEFGLGGDLQFQWSRLCATGELLWTRHDTNDRVGFTIEPGVFLWPDRIELVARMEWLNDNIGPSSAVDAWGASLGATFFSAARHTRLQAAYTLRRPGGTGDQTVTGWAVVRATFTL